MTLPYDNREVSHESLAAPEEALAGPSGQAQIPYYSTAYNPSASAQPTGFTAEVASIRRSLDVYSISSLGFPNFSSVIRDRSNGEGIGFYDTMMGTDPDLNGIFADLFDDVLHYQWIMRAAKPEKKYLEHADFCTFAFRSIPHFQNVLRHMVESYARGFSALEKMYKVQESGQWAGSVLYEDVLDKPQRWFNFGPDRELLFRSLANPFPGEPLPQEKFVVVTFGTNNNPWGFATLDDCYWAWFLKHHAMKNQAIFFEKWAQPTAVAKYRYNQNQEANKRNVEKALEVLQAFQADNAIALPDGIDLNLIEALRQGSVSYEAYVQQLTEMESRAITGQVLSSMGAKGGSYALGKVHEKREGNKVQMLCDFLEHQVSRNFVRELVDRNFGKQDVYPVFDIISSDPLETQAYAEVQKVLQQNGHVYSKKWSNAFFSIVDPTDAGDVLTPPPTAVGAQALPVNPTLAAPVEEAVVYLASPALHAKIVATAKKRNAQLRAVSDAAGKAAKPAVKDLTKHIAKGIKKAKKVQRAGVFKGLRGYDFSNLGDVAGSIFSGGASLG
jgi:phage gp29-like protein